MVRGEAGTREERHASFGGGCGEEAELFCGRLPDFEKEMKMPLDALPIPMALWPIARSGDLLRRLAAGGFWPEELPWSETLAIGLAESDGLGILGEEHLEVLREMRREFAMRGAVPSERLACRRAGQEPTCLARMFREPLEAWRIAGLPDPGEEAKAYL